MAPCKREREKLRATHKNKLCVKVKVKAKPSTLQTTTFTTVTLKTKNWPKQLENKKIKNKEHLKYLKNTENGQEERRRNRARGDTTR